MLHNRWYIKINLFPKTRLKRFVGKNQPHPFQANRQATEALLFELKPECFKVGDDGFELGVELRSPYDNIEEYIQKLKEAVVMVRDKRPIEPSWMHQRVSSVNLNSFFIGSDGCYIAVNKAVVEFKKVSTELCVLLQPADTETVGVYEHNGRLLTKLINSMQDITVKLLQTQLRLM